MTRARVKDVTFVLCSRAGGSAMSDWVPPAPARVEGYFKELNNWGRWGDGDQLGTVNLVTPAKRARAHGTVGRPVTPRELDAAAARSGVRVEPGDVVVVRSGDAAFRRAHPEWVARVSPHPGLHLSCLEWFREKDIAAIAWDMMDERPIGYAGFGMGAHLAIPFLGLALVDNTDPERLPQACVHEGPYQFLLTATPLPPLGSTGAPAHPLAIFSKPCAVTGTTRPAPPAVLPS